VSLMFLNAELDGMSALSNVHFPTLTGDLVNALCS
jgi:hypothetical protein